MQRTMMSRVKREKQMMAYVHVKEQTQCTKAALAPTYAPTQICMRMCTDIKALSMACQASQACCTRHLQLSPTVALPVKLRT